MEVSNAILATLAYYDGLEFPLTAFELYRYLINPQRLKPDVGSLPKIGFKEISELIDELIGRGSIIEELGFYSLKGRIGLAQLRLEREKISAQKWRRCLHKAYWLQAVPWIRGMFVSGSLALGTASEESDYDVLVIVEPGRLYLARIFLSGVASLIGARRTRSDSIAPDKFCFNHYLTTGALTIGHESLYNAQTYAHLVPMAVGSAMAGKFFAANLWLNKFVYNFTPQQVTVRRTVRPSLFFSGLAWLIERVLDSTLGDLFERWARRYQKERIYSNPVTHAPGGRVICNDIELEFHPHSFERVVLNHYNTATGRMGISVNPEPDSGLRK